MSSASITGAGGNTIKVPTGLFIENRFVPAENDCTLEVENPFNAKRIATVSNAQQADINKAVSVAKAALPPWRFTAPAKRAQLLARLADLIDRDAAEFASLEAVDAGILYGDSLHLHIPNAVGVLRYFAGWSDKLSGKAMDINDGIAYTRREPIGVCAAIIPWNAPLMITIWKLAPAIATGNTLIIKTPELCPLYGQKLATLVVEAGFPPGVINIVCGEGRIAGQAIADHMEIRKVAFTGSTLVGRGILKAAASSNLKKVTLELGGKGPSIVFPDADIENALMWTQIGITANNGQVCAAGSRIYVHRSIYDNFLKEFAKRASNHTEIYGDPLSSKTTKGPLISSAQHRKVLGYIEEGKSSAAHLLYGGKSAGGNFLENTAFSDVGDNDTIMKEEIFGPVAAIARFDTEAEVIKKANDSEYGLAAAVFTSDVSRAHRVAACIEAGQVTINSWGTLNPNTPFGGVKQSGFGRDMGEDALEVWTTVKVVKFNLLPSREESSAKL